MAQDDRRGLHLWQYRAVQDLFWLSAAVFLIWMGYVLRSVVTPLLTTLALAYVVHPFVSWLERRFGVPRLVSVSCLLVTLVAFVAAVLGLLAPRVFSEGQQLAERLPEYLGTLRQKIAAFDGPGSERLNELTEPDRVRSFLSDSFFSSGAEQGLAVVARLLEQTAYFALWGVLGPVFFFYFACQFEATVRTVDRLVPGPYRDRVRELATKMDGVVGGYVRGRLIAMVFLCVGFSVGWGLAGVPYWLLLGVLTGVLGAAPWLSAIGLPAAVLLQLADTATAGSEFDWLTVVVWPSVVFFAVQAIENYLITPWVQSEAMEMHPLTILVVILVGAAIGGAYGLLLALPAAGCLSVLAREVVLPRLERWAEDT